MRLPLGASKGERYTDNEETLSELSGIHQYYNNDDKEFSPALFKETLYRSFEAIAWTI
jgi:hypothetical protein